jgi:hypothetical protein
MEDRMDNPLEPPKWYDVNVTVKGVTIHMIVEADSLYSLNSILRLLLGDDRFVPQDIVIRKIGY